MSNRHSMPDAAVAALTSYEYHLLGYYTSQHKHSPTKGVRCALADIAAVLHMSVTQVSRVRRALALKGYIKVTRGRPDVVHVISPKDVPGTGLNVLPGTSMKSAKDVPGNTSQGRKYNKQPAARNQPNDRSTRAPAPATSLLLKDKKQEQDISTQYDIKNPTPLFLHAQKQFDMPWSIGMEKTLAALAADFSEPWVREAIVLAKTRKTTTIPYVKGILKSWKSDGKDTPDMTPKPRKPDTIAPEPHIPTPEERAEISKLMRELKPDFSAKAGA